MVAGTENQRASTRPHTKPLNKRKLNTSVLASKFSIFVFEAELSVHLNSVIAACGRESSLISTLGNKLVDTGSICRWVFSFYFFVVYLLY